MTSCISICPKIGSGDMDDDSWPCSINYHLDYRCLICGKVLPEGERSFHSYSYCRTDGLMGGVEVGYVCIDGCKESKDSMEKTSSEDVFTDDFYSESLGNTRGNK